MACGVSGIVYRTDVFLMYSVLKNCHIIRNMESMGREGTKSSGSGSSRIELTSIISESDVG